MYVLKASRKSLQESVLHPALKNKFVISKPIYMVTVLQPFFMRSGDIRGYEAELESWVGSHLQTLKLAST